MHNEWSRYDSFTCIISNISSLWELKGVKIFRYLVGITESRHYNSMTIYKLLYYWHFSWINYQERGSSFCYEQKKIGSKIKQRWHCYIHRKREEKKYTLYAIFFSDPCNFIYRNRRLVKIKNKIIIKHHLNISSKLIYNSSVYMCIFVLIYHHRRDKSNTFTSYIHINPIHTNIHTISATIYTKSTLNWVRRDY